MAYVEKVPAKFGQLVRLYGAEGRVADLGKRLACKFCKQHRRRAPRVSVEVSRPFYTKQEVAELTATDLDALVFSLEKLKPDRTIS